MPVDDGKRKLATILALDMAGYSAQSETNQERAIAYVAALRERAATLATAAGGHIFNTAGDGLMLEFPIASSAVRTAVTLAREAVAHPQTLPRLRAGVHLGEVIIDGTDRLGHGVNVAARLMQMAPPNGVVISDGVKTQLRGETDADFSPCGRVRLKKMRERIFAFEYIPQASLARRQWRRWRKPFVVAGAVVLIVIAALLGRRVFQPVPQMEALSIAVLPFDNLTGDRTLDYFPEGLATEVQSQLASNLKAATVFGRTTGFQFRSATAKSASHVRDTIGATHLVDGAFRRDGDKFRVDVELIDTRDGASIWQGSYEHPFQDALIAEADIARRVAREFNVAEPDMARPVMSPAALQHFLRAASLLDQVTENVPDLNMAVGELEAATQQAPNFARAWALLSRTYALQSRRRNESEQAALIAQARDAAQRALALDPNSALAEAMLGRVEPEWNWKTRETHFLRARTRAPNDIDVLGYWDDFLARTGRVRESRLVEERELRLDPLSQVAQTAVIGQLLQADDVQGAMQKTAQLQAQDPHAAVLWMQILNDRADANDLPGARRALQELERSWTIISRDKAWSEQQSRSQLAEFRSFVALISKPSPGKADSSAEAKAFYDRVTGPNVGQGCVSDYIHAVAGNGRLDLAWKMVETLYLDRGYVGTTDTCGRPVYPRREAATLPLFREGAEDLLRNPRIWRTFDAVGLTRYWRESGQLPDFCSDPKLPYDCHAMLSGKR